MTFSLCANMAGFAQTVAYVKGSINYHLQTVTHSILPHRSTDSKMCKQDIKQ